MAGNLQPEGVSPSVEHSHCLRNLGLKQVGQHQVGAQRWPQLVVQKARDRCRLLWLLAFQRWKYLWQERFERQRRSWILDQASQMPRVEYIPTWGQFDPQDQQVLSSWGSELKRGWAVGRSRGRQTTCDWLRQKLFPMQPRTLLSQDRERLPSLALWLLHHQVQKLP